MRKLLECELGWLSVTHAEARWLSATHVELGG